MELTDGVGVDAGLECVGADHSIRPLLRLLAPAKMPGEPQRVRPSRARGPRSEG